MDNSIKVYSSNAYEWALGMRPLYINYLEASRCPMTHENINTLFGVPMLPVADLPQVCSCGLPLTYAEELCFVPNPPILPNDDLFVFGAASMDKDQFNGFKQDATKLLEQILENVKAGRVKVKLKNMGTNYEHDDRKRIRESGTYTFEFVVSGDPGDWKDHP